MVKYLRGPCVSCRTLVTGAEGTDITCPNCKNVTRVPLISPPVAPEPVPAFEPEPIPETPIEAPLFEAAAPEPIAAEAADAADWPEEKAFDAPLEPLPESMPTGTEPAAATETVKPAGRGALVRALLGGALGALLGAISWGLLAKVMDTEDSNTLGFVAILVGLICGAFVLLFTLRNQGLQLKVVAVLATVFGIFGGKYLLYYVDQRSFGGSFMERVGYAFDPAVIGDFFNEVGKVFSALDVLWILVALVVAWIIPRPYLLGIKAKPKSKAASS